MNNSLDITAAADKSTRCLTLVADHRCDDRTARSTLDVLPDGTYRAIRSGYVVTILVGDSTTARQIGNLQVTLEQGVRGMQRGTVTLSDDGVVFQGE